MQFVKREKYVYLLKCSTLFMVAVNNNNNNNNNNKY